MFGGNEVQGWKRVVVASQIMRVVFRDSRSPGTLVAVQSASRDKHICGGKVRQNAPSHGAKVEKHHVHLTLLTGWCRTSGVKRSEVCMAIRSRRVRFIQRLLNE